MGLIAPKGQATPQPPEPIDDEPLYIPERSGVVREALRQLHDHDIPADEVIHVTSDAILFRQANRCKTAWIRWNGAVLIVVDESGWPADPSPWARAQLDSQTQS